MQSLADLHVRDVGTGKLLQGAFWTMSVAAAIQRLALACLHTEHAGPEWHCATSIGAGGAVLALLRFRALGYHASTRLRCRCTGGAIAVLLLCPCCNNPCHVMCALACGLCFSPFPPGVISRFATKQVITFKKVAGRPSKGWAHNDFSARILLQTGEEYEVKAYRDAIRQWSDMDTGVAYTMEVVRSCVTEYKGADKTGIRQTLMLRFPFVNRTVAYAEHTFPDSVLKERSSVEFEDIANKSCTEVFNVAGIVRAHGPESSTACEDPLPRISLLLQNGDWELCVCCVGDLARRTFGTGTKVFVVGVLKNERMGECAVETTYLSWVVEGADWICVRPPTDGERVRKALKTTAMEPATTADLRRADDSESRTIDAWMEEITESIFSQNLWYGENGDRMRLPVTLRDVHGTVQVIVWSRYFTGLISMDIQEMSALWCNLDSQTTGASKEELLRAFNARANKTLRWVLKPSLWAPSGQDPRVTWHVVAVRDVPPPTHACP